MNSEEEKRLLTGEEKRLLAVCDLNRTSWSLGEMIAVQHRYLMERYEHGLDKIDVLWFYDPRKSSYARKTSITRRNAHYYLSELFALVYVNQHLGSFIFMDSLSSVQDFIKKNLDKYHVYPPVESIGGDVLYHENSLRNTRAFYRKHGFVPYLSGHPTMLMWARSFIRENNLVYPITTQLRQRFGSNRDSKIEVWLEFFEFCQKEYKAFKFIVLGTREEIVSEFRTLDNVIFAKDYGTSAEQDFALLVSSVMFLGVASGPMTWARCCGHPYLVFNYSANFSHPAFSDAHKKKKTPLPYATPFQKEVLEVESKELVKSEFATFVEKIDFKQWKQAFKKNVVKGWRREDERTRKRKIERQKKRKRKRK